MVRLNLASSSYEWEKEHHVFGFEKYTVFSAALVGLLYLAECMRDKIYAAIADMTPWTPNKL